MHYNWRYVKSAGSRYPEIFILRTDANDKIMVEVNRSRAMVKISLDRNDRRSFESHIASGDILRETDLISGSNSDLHDIFAEFSHEISSLPNSEVLRMIGGNYDVMTRFLGTEEIATENNNGKPRDLVLIGRIIKRIGSLPFRITNGIKNFFISIIDWPRWWDFVDLGMIGALSWSVYQLNFNYMQTGIFACSGALGSGFIDWLMRRKDPYILKILFLFVPGILFAFMGYRFQ